MSFRAERSFTQNFDLSEHSSVWIEVPHAPTRVVQAGPDSNSLSYAGTWFALGGSEGVAASHAQGAMLMSEDLGNTLRIFAYWPLDADGLVELESDTLVLPRGRGLSLVAHEGELELTRLDGAIDVDLGHGSVLASDCSGHVAILTYAGSIEVSTAPRLPGEGESELDTAVDVHAFSGGGQIDIKQVGLGGVYVEAAHGDIEISLTGDSDLDITIIAGYGIDIDMPQLQVNEPGGQLQQTLGEGTQGIIAIAYAGSVRLTSE